jgi:hypothetical protein
MSFRRLFKGAYGPLLALCALVGVLWLGSYRSIAHAKLPVAAGGTRWEMTSYRGVLTVALIDSYPMDSVAAFVAVEDNEDLAGAWDERYWSGAIAGIAFEDAQTWLAGLDGDLVARRWSALSLPYWLLLSVTLLAPVHAAYIALRAYRRTTHNQCADCGYDLGDGEICQACAARAMLIGASARVQLLR